MAVTPADTPGDAAAAADRFAPDGGGAGPPAPGAPAGGDRRPGSAPQFARLKLRMLANRLQGSSGQVLLFLSTAFVGALFSCLGFFLFAAAAVGEPRVWLLAAGLGGTGLVTGAVLLPLVWFGVDDSLDPARFALLPLPRRRLVVGLFTAALLSVPAAGLLVATAGLLVPAAAHGGPGALLGQLVGVAAGLLLCVAAARAVTSAFAHMLRSRRMRDLAGILLALIAALVWPLQLLLTSTATRADTDQLVSVAGGLGWTPLAAPYTVGYELATGRPLAALAKLLITGVALLALLTWWSRTLESAMLGTTSGDGRSGRAARVGDATGSVARLFPWFLRSVPVGPTGAIVAREIRYWWRDPKRRANLISVTVIGVVAPVAVIVGGFGAGAPPEGGPGQAGGDIPLVALRFTLVFVGALAAVLVANQFGFDGTSYSAHLTSWVPGGLELRARAAALALLMVPLLLVLGGVTTALRGSPAELPDVWGVLLASFGAGLAVNIPVSVLAAYALPETSNPFATASGSGLAKSMLVLLTVIVTVVATAPVLVAAHLLPAAWPWLAVPAGAGYGTALAALSCYLTGDALDHRRPELLVAITPRG